MNHLFFETLNSTHSYLKDNCENLLKSDQNILISCNNQTDGIGRTGNRWLHNPQSLAMSFTLKPNPEISLSTIELGIISQKFLQQKFHFDVWLKWPNDLMNSKAEKVGGIISNFYSKEIILVGIGINLGPLEISLNESKNTLASIPIENEINLKDLAAEFYQFILNNRMSIEDILNSYNSICIHYNKKVTIDGFLGKFKGIKRDGSALLESNNKQLEFNSGHLTISSP